MNDRTFIVGVIATMILVLGIFAVIQNKKQMVIRKKYPGYPKGHWMSQGIGIGIAIGAAIGVALGNIAVGVGIGVAIGTAIGSGLEKQHKDEIRPITEEEKIMKRQSILFVVGTMMVGLIVFVITYFIAK